MHPHRTKYHRSWDFHLSFVGRLTSHMCIPPSRRAHIGIAIYKCSVEYSQQGLIWLTCRISSSISSRVQWLFVITPLVGFFKYKQISCWSIGQKIIIKKARASKSPIPSLMDWIFAHRHAIFLPSIKIEYKVNKSCQCIFYCALCFVSNGGIDKGFNYNRSIKSKDSNSNCTMF